MSTTFEVYPTSASQPDYGSVIQTAETFMRSCLSRYSISFNLKILANVHFIGTGRILDIDPSLPFILKENEYAWFHYMNVPGGTDAYSPEVDDDIRNHLLHAELLNNNRRIQNIAAKIEQVEKNSNYWYFRRSAGQPAIICLTYGMLAASVAKHTAGIIYSDDNAWTFEKFPCEYDEFLKFFFNPSDVTNGNEFNEWSRRCIAEIRRQIRRYT
jgi:hypothetical protein